MTPILIIIAGISLITGLLLIFAPNALIRAGELFNRLYNLDSLVYSRRRVFGLIFIVLGVILILLAQ